MNEEEYIGFTYKHQLVMEKYAKDYPNLFTFNEYGLWMDTRKIKIKLKTDTKFCQYPKIFETLPKDTIVDYYVRITPTGIYRIVEYQTFVAFQYTSMFEKSTLLDMALNKVVISMIDKLTSTE